MAERRDGAAPESGRTGVPLDFVVICGLGLAAATIAALLLPLAAVCAMGVIGLEIAQRGFGAAKS